MKYYFFLLVLLTLVCPSNLLSQSTSASLTGFVDDPQKAVLPGASVTAINTQTGDQSRSVTNASGQYVIPDLPPGTYRIEVGKQGFKGIIEAGVVLHVQDVIQLNFHMALGSMSETVSVEASGTDIDTTDGAVSTVVDRQFVENLPLNGRSFQSLLLMTPGVDLNVGPGQSNARGGQAQGQFVVDGQRSDQNYWTVDGVSANVGISTGVAGNGVAGSIGATNVVGGTGAIVSVDALQEFRIETSTYAPEFGRQPGAQISIVTRSGANQFHGTVFDYFRNTVLDATDWFADHDGLQKSPEQQNDFGGVLGGPIVKNKFFFFFSYEGLRLNLPETFTGTVPDLSVRQSAIAAMQPYLNAYPLPKIGVADVSPGLAPYNASYSEPFNANAYSLRVDYQLPNRHNLFARYNHAPSSGDQRGAYASTVNTNGENKSITKTATVGDTWMLSSNKVNEARFNYSVSGGSSVFALDTYGGAVPPSSAASLFPSSYTLANSQFEFLPTFGTNMYYFQGLNAFNYQHQYNLVDTFSEQIGSHNLKVGVDYRRLTPDSDYESYSLQPLFEHLSELESGSPALTITVSQSPADFLLRDLSLFAQDTWRVRSRLTLTYGLRWDVDFRPASDGGPDLPALTGFNVTNLSNLALAPAGTPAYGNRYAGIAPRIGGAFRLGQNRLGETVVRSGFGLFYGLMSTEVGSRVPLNSYPYEALNVLSGVPFPTPSADAAPPQIVPPNTQNGLTLFGFDPNLNLPYALEWNVAVEQGFGKAQTLAASYIGAKDSRQLLSESIANPNPNYASAFLVGNFGKSSYNALQVKFQRDMAQGLQALLSYTWSHSIDNGSYGAYSNGSLADVDINRGDSDYDVRNVFTGAVSYVVPAVKADTFTRTVTGGWSLHNIVQTRSGPPVDVTDGNFSALSYTTASAVIRPDTVPNQPFYLSGSQYPGGKELNPDAFIDPPVDSTTGLPTRQGDLGRNVLRSLGLVQWDFAVHREFPIHESMKLEFRGELFNVLNHPNFGAFNSNFQTGNAYFGQATEMLDQYLGGLTGSGTQNPLYTPGGPRSGQLALKLVF